MKRIKYAKGGVGVLRVAASSMSAVARILTTFVVGIGVVLLLFGHILRLLPSSRSSPDLSRWSNWPRRREPRSWFGW